MKDRRALFRTQASALYLPLYDALCEELPLEWEPYCLYRGFKDQADRWNQGRTKPGKIITRAKPGESPHQYQCASDWTIWDGEVPRWPDKHDPIWEIYTAACEKIGLRTLSFECPHNEISIDCKWTLVHEQFETFGMEAAQAFIKTHVRR